LNLFDFLFSSFASCFLRIKKAASNRSSIFLCKRIIRPLLGIVKRWVIRGQACFQDFFLENFANQPNDSPGRIPLNSPWDHSILLGQPNGIVVEIQVLEIVRHKKFIYVTLNQNPVRLRSLYAIKK